MNPALALLLCLAQQTGTIEPLKASQFFSEARWASEEDGGKLWGKALYGPMIFVDPRSRAAVANEMPADSGFASSGDVYVGTLPPEVTVANTALNWKGKRWSMLMWPLPTARVERARIMMHEAWHRIQDEIGLPAVSQPNAHLDTLNGRLWLQLEVRALRAAMLGERTERELRTRDALLFRAQRQSLFPGSKALEDRMEVHEGLAEYTGLMLRGTWEPETRYGLAYRLLSFGKKLSFPASFAYETGAAYGLLLNVLEAVKFDEITWQKTMKAQSSLTDMVAKLVEFRAPSELQAAAVRAAGKYGYQALLTSEREREKGRLSVEQAYMKSFVKGPVLVLPLVSMNYTYNPNATFPLGELGTVHRETTVTDEWGKIVVTMGALIAKDFTSLTVTAPRDAARRTAGEGWDLQLNAGWTVVPGTRPGDYVVRRS